MSGNIAPVLCEVCQQSCSNQRELRQHMELYSSRAQRLAAELEKCLAHIRDYTPAANEPYKCPHEECLTNLKNSFSTWETLSRHYGKHIPCVEKCGFCGRVCHRIKEYVSHVDDCPRRKSAAKRQGRDFETLDSIVRDRRRFLMKRTFDLLDLVVFPRADDIPDPDDSDSHSAQETGIAASIGSSLNGAISPTLYTAQTSLPLHVENSTVINGNGGTFPVGSDGSNDTFMTDSYTTGGFVTTQVLSPYTTYEFPDFDERVPETSVYQRMLEQGFFMQGNLPTLLFPMDGISSFPMSSLPIGGNSSLPMDRNSSYTAGHTHGASSELRFD